LRKLPCVVFADDEIVVIEVHGIHPVSPREHRQVTDGTRWGLLTFFTAKHGDDAAKIAAVWAADRRLIHSRAAPQESRSQIGLDRTLIVGRLRKSIRSDPPPLGSNPMVAVRFPESQSGDGLGVAMAGNHVEQLDECLLTLPANDPIDV